MQLHNLTERKNRTRFTRVGRGGKRGKTSGRGGKGQTARAGAKFRPEMRDIIKKLPKRRGHGKNRARTVRSERVRYTPVNLSALNVFAAGEVVSPKTLILKGVVKTSGGKIPKVKILGTGSIKTAVSITGCTISATAKEAILAAGGTVA